jgi:recombination DNA repair RAD52 pathway protein
MARATGGKMLTPHDGLAFEKSIREAAEDALKPAYCP